MVQNKYYDNLLLFMEDNIVSTFKGLIAAA